ncbi:hypothetical protein [Streptomyces griseorubiginosus]|uniref:hypothetical protein n=1 Tax=Streptomyces griseorubiginosus TaxID=67304 RepID=UPI0036EC7218
MGFHAAHRVHAVGIPGWSVWIFLFLFSWQVLVFFVVLRRLREADSDQRGEACLDLLDAVGSLLLLGGGLLGLVVGESWFLLGLAGFPLMTAANVVKGVHWLRARRHPTT